jgi:hypothetical protein
MGGVAKNKKKKTKPKLGCEKYLYMVGRCFKCKCPPKYIYIWNFLEALYEIQVKFRLKFLLVHYEIQVKFRLKFFLVHYEIQG